MLIIAGQLEVDNHDRHDYLETCKSVVEQARNAPGCLDFTITADPIAPERVNVFERWESDEALARFRGSGPDDGLGSRIRSADVHKYRISGIESP